MKKLLKTLLDLIYPRGTLCMSCGSRAGFRGEWLCKDCREILAQRYLGAFDDKILEMSAAAYAYAGPAGGMVRALKYRGYGILAESMAKDMLKAYNAMQPTASELIVPVPMHPKRLRKRGFNHAERLAEQLSSLLDLPVETALKRLRDTPQQALLTGKERRENVRGAFTADACVKGRNILLVDDVFTTGATARECTKALRDAGANIVALLVYAKGGDLPNDKTKGNTDHGNHHLGSQSPSAIFEGVEGQENA